MKKVLFILGIVGLLSFFSFSFIYANRRLRQTVDVQYLTTIILDAGHGGKDGGAESRDGLVERDLVFSVTQLVAQNLRMQGFHVVLTRPDAQDLASPYAQNRKREDLAKRVDILNTTENAIAISIHANAINNARWSGAQVFYDAKSLENKALATHIMNSIEENIAGMTREVRPISNIYILRHSQIPTALVEVGFLSNVNEATLLADENYQRLMAYAIFEGILSYIESLAQKEPSIDALE